ncbi:MAG: Type IV pilus biogenesis factor PilY1 [Gammaproteobacteria bacterium]|nr:Type IV pilus biogenesis factor PilY1 [Gammaproteobacteria bacterium]
MAKQRKQHIARSLRITAIAALYAGTSIWSGLNADDTQIYINELPSAQTPNVLFTIDTSGSMNNDVPDGSQTRMEAVQGALTGLINDTSNLKAGLGSFHDELGGPINFPVVDLDDTPDFLEGSTGREALLSIIDDLVATGFTPTVDALFEGGAYFEGAGVHFGRTRGAGQSYESSGVTSDSDLDSDIQDHTDAQLLDNAEVSRLSHFATYDPQNASIVREGSCTANDPNNTDCRTEHIDNAATPTYVSPFDSAESCEKGFMVLLSDGRANRNSSRDLIKNLTGLGSCPLDIPQINSSGEAIITGGNFDTRDPDPDDELCALELSDYLHDKDFIDEADDETDISNNVRTFTVGFDLDIEDNDSNRKAVEFLKALAFVGSGGDIDDPDGVDGVEYGDGFYTADSASELQSVFETIFDEIIDEATSFVAPGSSVNAFNRMFNLDDIYFNLFQPNASVDWSGNLKKFKLCTDQPGCEFGETIDKNGDPAVHDDITDLDTFGTLKTDAEGFWSASSDSAPEINEGGAGELIPTFEDRTVYVNTDSGDVPSPDFNNDPVKSQGTAPHEIDLDDDVGSAPDSGDPDDFNDLKTALRDQGNCDSGSLTNQNDCLNDLIEWITGKKFSDDEPRDGTEEDEDRWAFGDPMHSGPLILTYGNDTRDAGDPDDDVPLSKIFVGTNDGGIRMINEGDGVEEWIFFPNSMLAMQSDLKDGQDGTHPYGIDGTPSARIKDADGDGIIEPESGEEDFVHLYFGLRRGGRSVFALNATPDSTVDIASQQTLNEGTDNEFKISIGEKGKVAPEILWRIDGSDDDDFQRLGQTWSTPRPARVQGSDGPRTVLIFGGGYDTQQDGTDNDGTAPDGGDMYNTSSDGDSMGNAIFIVDADTGERLWWASSSADGNGDAADAVVSDMNTSIPAPVTLLDINGDNLTDRLYAVDLRGQVFRVDLASELGNSSVGVLARLGSAAANADRRKFFYAPEVARVNDQAVVEEPYELIGIVSGNRSEPQGKTVQDRAYAIRDFLTNSPSGGLSSSNFPKCNPQAGSCPTPGEPLSDDDLMDVTDKNDFVIRQKNDSGAISLVDSEGDTVSSAVLDDLKQSHGWYFDLEGDNFDDPTATDLTGEKGFSTVTVLDGKMFFTTYLPPDTTTDNDDVCSASGTLGTSRFYAIDFFTGAPAFDRNGGGTFSKAERFTSLGAGPSADVVPAYLPGGVTLPVPTGAGALPQDPQVSNLVNKTFWLEER